MAATTQILRNPLASVLGAKSHIQSPPKKQKHTNHYQPNTYLNTMPIIPYNTINISTYNTFIIKFQSISHIFYTPQPTIHPSLPPRGRPALPHPRRGRCAALGHGDGDQAQVQRRQRGLAGDPGLGRPGHPGGGVGGWDPHRFC